MTLSERKIIHIDMDAFYASIEQRDFPELKGKPVIVGSPENRGVVSAASYEARVFGVRSAMSSVKARLLCPQAIFVRPRMDVYRTVSHQIHDIFNDYTDLIEPLSYDEAFLDVTENKKNIPLAKDIAIEIKERIRQDLNLVASAGVSYNKFLAKIASDYKKPDGLYVIHPRNAEIFIESLPIDTFWGVGKVTSKKMSQLGIRTGKDLKACTIQFLTHHFGKQGIIYYNFSRGIDNRSVDNSSIRKSVGCENTFDHDLKSFDEAVFEIRPLIHTLLHRLKRNEFKGKTLTVKVKYDDFTIKTKSQTVTYVLDEENGIYNIALQLLQDFDYSQKGIRLLGLSVSVPYKKIESEEQLTLPFPDFDI